MRRKVLAGPRRPDARTFPARGFHPGISGRDRIDRRIAGETFPEDGSGHTYGNSLRRVLLSSLEGAAITAIKITGAQHEFATLPGVVEDVTDIVLNLKRIKFKAAEHEPRRLSLSVNKEGEVTAGDI